MLTLGVLHVGADHHVAQIGDLGRPEARMGRIDLGGIHLRQRPAHHVGVKSVQPSGPRVPAGPDAGRHLLGRHTDPTPYRRIRSRTGHNRRLDQREDDHQGMTAPRRSRGSGISATPSQVGGGLSGRLKMIRTTAAGVPACRLIEAWSGRATETDEIFPLLDGDGDGRLSREEFVRLWKEFGAGDDPDAAGSLVFGCLEPPMARR